jgi:hypothetical protein
MYYQATDKSLHYLDDERFLYLLPPGSEPVSDARAAALQTTAPVVPTLVSRFQARSALVQAGYFDAVDAHMAALPKINIQRMAWDEAADFDRTSTTLVAMAAMLGLDNAALDALFVAAAAIEA